MFNEIAIDSDQVDKRAKLRLGCAEWSEQICIEFGGVDYRLSVVREGAISERCQCNAV